MKTDKVKYEVCVDLGGGKVGYLEHNGRNEWVTKRIAEKHAKETTEQFGWRTLVRDASITDEPNFGPEV